MKLFQILFEFSKKTFWQNSLKVSLFDQLLQKIWFLPYLVHCLSTKWTDLLAVFCIQFFVLNARCLTSRSTAYSLSLSQSFETFSPCQALEDLQRAAEQKRTAEGLAFPTKKFSLVNDCWIYNDLPQYARNLLATTSLSSWDSADSNSVFQLSQLF